MTDVSAGHLHSLMLLSDESVVCWGNDEYGLQIPPLTPNGVIQIDAGYYHSIQNSPAPGACCVAVGCEQMSQEDCAAVGGEWLGEEISCDACDALIGACCVVSGCTQLDEVACNQLGGGWTSGGSCDDCQSPCPADLNGDDLVDVLDLLELIAAWGGCP